MCVYIHIYIDIHMCLYIRIMCIYSIYIYRYSAEAVWVKQRLLQARKAEAAGPCKLQQGRSQFPGAKMNPMPKTPCLGFRGLGFRSLVFGVLGLGFRTLEVYGLV